METRYPKDNLPPELWREYLVLCKQPEGYNKRGVNNLLDPPGHYITRVIRVNKLVLFILSTRPLTLLFWKEVLGEPLPYLRSTRSLTGANSLYNIGGSDWTSSKSKNFARRLSSNLNSQILRRNRSTTPNQGPIPTKTRRSDTWTMTKTRRKRRTLEPILVTNK